MKASTRVDYVWRPNSRRHNIDPQLVGETLEKLGARTHPGGVSPEEIVRAAEPENAPLHPLFEWDDEIAAHHWRVSEARHVVHDLRTVVVTNVGEVRENTRAFVNVVEGERRGYVMAVRVASDRFLMRQTVAAAVEELNAWRQRYANLQALAAVFNVLDRELDALAELVEESEHEPEPI